MKRGESWKKDVQLTFAARFGYCAGHVRIVEDERGFLDPEVIERTAGGSHGSGDVSLPIIWERFAVQRSQQIEIDRCRLQLDVLHRQNGPARGERHVPKQM